MSVAHQIAAALKGKKAPGQQKKGKGAACMDFVRSLPYPRHWLAQLKPDSRPLPDINQPHIGCGDWEESMKVSWEHGWVGKALLLYSALPKRA